jgi:voltage-gated potassium channel
VSFCDLYRLDREMFNRVLSHYPDIAAQIESTAKARQERG